MDHKSSPLAPLIYRAIALLFTGRSSRAGLEVTFKVGHRRLFDGALLLMLQFQYILCRKNKSRPLKTV